MSNIALKTINSGGISLQIPEVWTAITETYTEPDGRECTMIDISAEEGDPRSIVISYGPMQSWKQEAHMRSSSGRSVQK